jgi:hypothetical protein
MLYLFVTKAGLTVVLECCKIERLTEVDGTVKTDNTGREMNGL